MDSKKIKDLVSKMTLEEKAGITVGKDGWFTKALDRLGIPEIRVSDGPHGLRALDEQNMNSLEGQCLPAVCFPPACASASSFDPDLLYEMGEEIAEECKAYGVEIVLGPGLNIKRSPLCGRNFEYFSEDPIVSGKMGAAFINGVQAHNVGTSLKHFFANNQEHRRMSSSSEMDERTAREIYLTAFEYAVKNAHPYTVMAAYNKINGTYCTANKRYITDMLRREWGFDGLVVSDWGATHDRAGVIKAGCDLTMPGEDTNMQIIEAVKHGELDEAVLDISCERILELVFRCVENRQSGVEFNFERGHALAKRIADNSAVLLKNDGVLPLDQNKKIVFIGEFADVPRMQGGGSSHINCPNTVGALAAAKKSGIDVSYAKGYNADGSTTDELIAEAVKMAKLSDVAVLLIGLPDDMETEGIDRKHMRLPEGHNRLVAEVSKVVKTVVVLHNGSPVEMPWINDVNGLIEVYLGGEAVGETTVDVLYGKVNPSGRLAETFPIRLEDNPSYLFFGGEGNVSEYREGVFVGYRYYTTKNMSVQFPFGYGLSYTDFEYSDITVDKDSLRDGDIVKVSVTVKNVGKRDGKEVVQLYVAPKRIIAIRPLRELKAFQKISLKAGESKTVTFELDYRAFAHWNLHENDWRVESGDYGLQICRNSNEVIAEKNVYFKSAPIVPGDGFSNAMLMRDFADFAEGYAFLNMSIQYMIRGMAAMGYVPNDIVAMFETIPGGLTLDSINKIGVHSQHGRGGENGLTVLLNQSLGILVSFLPHDKKKELDDVIYALNKKYGFI